MGLLLTVLGTVYTAYPALRARRRASMTRALVVGLAGGVTVASIATGLTLVGLGLYALVQSAAVGSALPFALQGAGRVRRRRPGGDPGRCSQRGQAGIRGVLVDSDALRRAIGL